MKNNFGMCAKVNVGISCAISFLPSWLSVCPSYFFVPGISVEYLLLDRDRDQEQNFIIQRVDGGCFAKCLRWMQMIELKPPHLRSSIWRSDYSNDGIMGISPLTIISKGCRREEVCCLGPAHLVQWNVWFEKLSRRRISSTRQPPTRIHMLSWHFGLVRRHPHHSGLICDISRRHSLQPEIE